MLKKKELFIFLLLSIIFILLALPYISLSGSCIIDDEGILAYQTYLTCLGYKPYKEFLYINLPLPLYIYAPLIKISGTHFFIIRLFNLIFVVITAFFILSISKLYLSFRLSIVFPLLFFFTSSLFFYHIHFLHDSLGWIFAVSSFYFILRNSLPFFSGILIGCALLTKQTTLPLIFLSLLLSLSSIKKLPKLFAGTFFILLFSTIIWGDIPLILGYFSRFQYSFSTILGNLKLLFKNLFASSIILYTITFIFISIPLIKNKNTRKVFTVLILFSCFFIFSIAKAETIFSCRHFFFLIFYFFFFLTLYLKIKPSHYRVILYLIIFFMALQIPYFINYYQSKEYFTLRDKKISEFILSTTTSSDFILTDYSRFSFLTKRPTPPSLTDLSYGISHHVEINADFIIKKLKKFNIPLVIIQTEGPTALHLKNIPDFPKLQKYLRENYFYYGNLTNGREVFEIYLKNSRILFNSSSLK